MESEERKKSGEDKASNPKRQMKTPSQLEVLERVYADNRYPSEAVRAELAVQLNLTDRQLQMWFCHRRLKDRKDDENPGPSKKQKKEKAPKVKDAPAPSLSPTSATGESVGIVGQAMSVVTPSMAVPSSVVTPSPPPPPSSKKSSKKKQQPKLEQPVFTPEQHAELAAIRTVEQQLGEPLREDGPVLGSEFDPLPPGAFDTPIEPADQRMYALEALRPAPNPEFPSLLGNRRMSPQTTNRIPREHQFIPEHPTVSQFHERNIVSKVERDVRAKAPAGAGPLIPSLSLNFFHPAEADGEHDEPPPPKPFLDIERPSLPESTSKKRKSDDAKLARELEQQEKRLKREADKQEAARRKREEQERKEIEKMNRERQKEIEKINRERQREEERLQREQKKEQDRMEKLALKEQQRLEKLRVKEEQRRQKEAAKMQAAYERATAKKLAKLSTGLLEDEQLELMQMGAFVQGLVTADMEGANFDTSKVELKRYPPASVRMKKVLGVAPWESQQNVANLLMVWRFLTTFSDAIGLWPFTVDEFVQGLHDFDSRLLNEIYVALLKTLIKDVEDAAQAAASGNAGSQHAIAVAAGGHPQIVEAAYTWGFDIQEWGQHLNPLTWPEVLRQFALAAGYGPRWKKRSLQTDQKSDLTEVNDGHNANAIATLRSGAAAVNAVALMRGKNATRVKLKKAQMPKLTPGTVKYAAFHVLSIEGGKGLTITELTDRIQKSGLRDLSSSKTPEASISAALSRDTVLFERVAPSTYCVRSPFRRDTDDAEDVIQAALERTYLYQTRQLDPDKADELIDDAEEESEGDEHDTDEPENEAEHEHEPEAADPETNFDTPSKPGKVILRLKTGKLPHVSGEREAAQGEPSTSEPVSVEKEGTKPEVEDEGKHRTSLPDSGRKDDDDMEIDESQVGEPWVQGLMEGEFADLSIEERLNALVALVDVLNEGNTIRSVLEARYEAASAFKRQLWEEVQVDKRRLKEELTKSGAKAEAHDDERQNNTTDLDNVASTSASLSDKSRVQVKAEIRLRAEKLYVIRSLPLGSDRRYNRYWQFAASTGGEDPGRARIYFESNEDGHFEVIDTEEALDALLASLDTRGIRESSLYNVLTQVGGPLRKAMKSLAQLRASEVSKSEGSPSSGVFGPSDVSEASSALSVELGRNKLEIQHAMDRFKDLEKWLWNRCLMKGNKSLKAVNVGAKQDVDSLVSCEFCHSLFWSMDGHCSSCHTAIDDESHLRECEERAKSLCSFQIPPRLQLLKHLLVVVEVAIPADAFKSSWTSACRKSWCDAVKDAHSVRELLQAFTVLEGSVDEKWISSTYETTEKALSSTVGPAGSHLKNLPWVPQTTAAVALRLCAFDAAIAFNTEQRDKFEQRDHIQQQTPVAGHTTVGVDEESPSSPDSDSPPDFPNGHSRLPPRPQGRVQGRMRACNANNAAGRKISAKEPKQPLRQPAQQQGRGKGRLSFRVQGRVVSSNDSYQREAEEPPPLIHHPTQATNEEDEESDGWERQSDETEHSDDEPEQQQEYYHQQHPEAAHHLSQMPQHEQNEQEETDEDEEYEEQQQPQEQYEEEYYEDEYDQDQHHHHQPFQQHQHQQAQPVGGMMMMDEEDEEVEVEEVEEEMSEEE